MTFLRQVGNLADQTVSSFEERLRRALTPRYSVEHEIASGGMGIVYLGYDSQLERSVAIKVLRPDGTAAAVERFRREATSLAGFRHPHIVPVHDAGIADGIPYYVMDYLAGETVADRIARGPLPLIEVRRLALDLLAALAAAHARGVIHRDVKPSNLVLVDGEAVLTDFGIAKLVTRDRSALTEPGQQPRTPAYSSPEQLAGDEVTAQSDLYSAAMVIYEAYTARPWSVGDAPEAADWTGVPATVALVLQRGLQWSPAERWGSAQEFRKALQRSERPTRARWLTVAGALLLIGGGLTLSIPKLIGRSPAAELALYPFDGAVADEKSLGYDLAFLTTVDLEHFQRIRLSPRHWSFGWWQAAHDAAAARRPVPRPPAGYQVEGAVSVRGDSVLVRLVVRDSVGRLFGQDAVTGAARDKSGLADEVAFHVIRLVRPDLAGRFHSTPGLWGHSVEALDEYLTGEEAFQRDAWYEAELHFQRALSLDPDFTRAAWRLWYAQSWRRVPTTVDLRRLIAYAGRLGDVDSLLIAAQLAPGGPSRNRLYEAALQRAPREGNPALLYGAELFHRGPLAGIALDSAARVLEEAVARDPVLAPAHDHLVWALIRLGYRAEAESALVRLERNATADSLSEVDPPDALRLAFAARFAPAVFERQLPAVPGALQPYLIKTMRLALSLDIPEAERRLGQMLAGRPGAGPVERADGHEAQGLALVALGRGLEALPHFDSAAALFGAAEARLQAAEWRVVPAALGMWDTAGAGEDRARAALEALTHRSDRLAPRAAWALALSHLGAGDTVGASAWMTRVRSSGPPPPPPRLALLLDAQL